MQQPYPHKVTLEINGVEVTRFPIRIETDCRIGQKVTTTVRFRNGDSITVPCDKVDELLNND
jgi:hypothetical protein